MEQASFRESIEFYGRAFGSSMASTSAQPADQPGESLGGWRNAIHYRINSTMQKVATFGGNHANRIRLTILTLAFGIIQSVFSILDAGAAGNTSHVDPEDPAPPARDVSESDASFRSTSSVDRAAIATPGDVRTVRKILSDTVAEPEPEYGTLGSPLPPPRTVEPSVLGPPPPGPPPGPPPASAFLRSPPPSVPPTKSPDLKSPMRSVSTQTDAVGPVAYMQYLADMPEDGTIASLPDVASFMSSLESGIIPDPELNDRLDTAVSTITDMSSKVMSDASKRILRTAEKLDTRLEAHLESLEAKANAVVSISAVDIEAEERRQRQERAQEQLIQDSQRLFHLQYEVEAATLLLNQQLTKRSDQNLSNIQADIQEEDASTRLKDFDDTETPEAVSSTSSSSKVNTTSPHAEWDSSDDESSGRSSPLGRPPTPSEAGTAQITIQQKELKQRIDTLTAVKEDFKRKLIECAADIANTTAGTGKNKSGAEFLERLKAVKISPDATNAENAKTIKDLLVAWLGCNLQECWALTPWLVRIRNSGIDGYLPCIRATVNKVVERKSSGEINHQQFLEEMKTLGFVPGKISEYTAAAHPKSYFDPDTAEGQEHIEQDQLNQLALAVTAFTKANAKAFDTLQVALGDKVKKAVDDNGRMLCHRERRLNRAAQHDIIGVIESWLLTVDTYGSEAIEQVRDHLRYGLAYFVDTNPKQAIPKLLKVVDRAEALGARITYAYSIEKYMKVLQLQRPAIASQLESAYGAPPVKLEDDQKRRIREFAQAYLHKMEQADSIAQQLRNNPGDKEYRNSITAILLAHERQYGPKPSQGSGPRQSGTAENGQHVNGNSNKRFANYVPPKSRNKEYYGRKKFDNRDQRDTYYGIYKDNKRCCDAQGGRYCGHSQLDDSARNHWQKIQRKSDQEWRKGKPKSAKFAGPYSVHVCTECIKKAISDGTGTIKCAQPGRTLSVERANVTTLVREGGEAPPEKDSESETPPSPAPAPSSTPNSTPPTEPSDSDLAERKKRVAQAQAEMAIEEAELEMQERRRALDARKAQLAADPDDQES